MPCSVRVVQRVIPDHLSVYLATRLPLRRLAEPALEATRREDEGMHAGRPTEDLSEKKQADMAWVPAWPKRLIGRGWPRLGAAWSTICR